MSDIVTVASRFPTALLMQAPTGGDGVEQSVTLVGPRDPSAVHGWGLTPMVDAAAFEAWLTANPFLREFLHVATDEEIAHYSDPANTHGFEVGLNPPTPPEPPDPEPPPITDPPVNVDIPYAEQSGLSLTCTMGNWNNEPASYVYLWRIDGTPSGTSAVYGIKPEDVGHTANCTVTATNAIGSTTAPPSNDVVIT